FLWNACKEPSVLLVPGVARTYSRQVRFFCACMKMRPGNLVVGFKDTSGLATMPFDEVLEMNFDLLILDNYRRMLEYVFPDGFDGGKILGRSVHANLPEMKPAQSKPVSLPFAAKKYFVIHICGTRARYSLPPRR